MNRIASYISGQYKKNVVIPLEHIRKQGFTSEKLALSVSLGVIGGTFPIIGLASLVCLLLTILFRQNLIIVQLTNYLVYPLQIILLLPLMRIGNSIIAGNQIALTLSQVVSAFKIGIWHGINEIGIISLYGALAWTIVAIPALVILYIIFLVFFKRIRRIKLNHGAVISR